MRFESKAIEKFYKDKILSRTVRRSSLVKFLDRNQDSERIVTVVRYEKGEYLEFKLSIKEIRELLIETGIAALKANGSIKKKAAIADYNETWWILP